MDLLDIVQVHGDGGDVAEKARALAVGRDVDVFADVGAVEQQRVDAGLAFDGVAAVARIPPERVVAGAEQRDVVAAAPSMKSLPSPPISMSAPRLPRIVSLPAPPSMVSSIVLAGASRRDRVVAAERL